MIKSPSFQFLRHVGQKSLEETLCQICRSIVFDKIYCIRTCWWAQAAAIMTSLVSFPPPRTGCGEGRSERMFSLPSILLLQSYMPAGKAADTIARKSKSSRQLKQKFSHTRKCQKMRPLTTISCRQLIIWGLVVDNLHHRLRFLVVDNF